MTLPNGQPLRWDTPGARWDGTVAEVMAALEPPTNTTSMPQNLISATLTKTLADELIADFAAIRDKMDFLRTLSAEETKRIVERGTGSEGLNNVLYEAARENPGKLAADFPKTEWETDRAFIAEFARVFTAADKLTADMRDTLTAAQSDDYAAGREAYDDLKRDAQGPKIDQARALMRARFGGRRPPTPPTP
jgi:hypothetical protein